MNIEYMSVQTALVNICEFLFSWTNKLDTKDWVQIFSTLALGIIAFLAPSSLEKWKLKYLAPKIAIKFKLEPPYSHLTQTNNLDNVYYFRLGIINKGRGQAEECEVTLDAIQKKKDGIFVKIQNFTPVNLKWSGINIVKSLNIQPEREIFCDLGKIYQSTNITEAGMFIFEQIEIYNSQPHALLEGEYKIKVSVYAKNTKKVTQDFSVNWKGESSEDPDEMFRKIVIQQI